MIPPLSEGQEPDFSSGYTPDEVVPHPLKPIGRADAWRYLEDHSDAVMLYCACSGEPRMMVSRATIPVWKCAACESHLFARTER
jgi:hypothetical protein